MTLSRLKNFSRDESGNVALMVSLALPVLILTVGGGADYANQLQRKSQLQNAVDSAALAAHLHYQKHPSISDAQLKTYFGKHLRASLPPKLASAISITQETVQLNRNEDTLRAWVKAKSPTSFMRIAAINTVTLSTFAEVKSSPSYTEVALVLDTTDSMQGQKIRELKRAAKTFLDTIHAKLTGKPEAFKVAVVPFSMYVNVGKQYRNASWISVPPDKTFYGRLRTSKQCSRWTCVQRGYRWKTECWWTGSADAGNRRKVCERRYKQVCIRGKTIPIRPCITHSWRPSKTIKWQGCVGSRNYPLNIRDERYDVRVPGVMEHPRDTRYPPSSEKGWRWREWNNCPTALIPLTPLKTGRSKLVSKINNLRTNGWTFIPSGLVWGWRVLSPDAPFTEGVPWTEVKQKNVQKIIVLMTDGANTRSPDQRRDRAYADHQGYDRAYADQLLTQLCNNIKATNPATGKPYADIITVTFDVRDPNIKRLLQQCSTLGSYDAKSGQLVQIFDKIAKKLAELHLSK